MTKDFPAGSRARQTLLALSVIIVLTTACLSKGADDGDAGGATAESVVFGTELGPATAEHIIPAGAEEIRVQLVLNGVEAGMKITVRWFRLGDADVPSEGGEVGSDDIILSPEDVLVDGTAVNFVLASGPSGFAEDAWLLRIYVNGGLVRTTAFVVSGSLNAAAAATAQPTAVFTPGPSPTPINYTVVAGDTLQLIAQRFLPDGELLGGYLDRIADLNDITTSELIQIGQPLLIPGPR